MPGIEILTIGDELVEGRLVDTNAADLSERLAARGLEVTRHCSVGDDLDRIAGALREAAARSAAVLVSGGLGPTGDDLTAAGAAAAFGLPLRRSAEALEHVRRFFADRGRRMTDNNAKQADLPEGCALLPNPEGTAVGFRLVAGGCRLYFMPGVPRELHRIFADSVLPDLESFLQASPAAVATIKVFGKGESEVAQMLEGLDDELPAGVRLVVQYRATFPEIHLRLVASGEDATAAAAAVDRLAAEARRRLGGYAFAWGGALVPTTFPEHAISVLRAAGKTLAAVEGCSGGELAALAASAPDAGEVFLGSLAASAGTAQQRLLGVGSGFDDDPLSRPAAEALARAARERFGADLGVVTVGSAAPSGGHPAGALIVAVADGHGVTSRELLFPVDAERFRRLAAYVALALVVRSLDA